MLATSPQFRHQHPISIFLCQSRSRILTTSHLDGKILSLSSCAWPQSIICSYITSQYSCAQWLKWYALTRWDRGALTQGLKPKARQEVGFLGRGSVLPPHQAPAKGFGGAMWAEPQKKLALLHFGDSEVIHIGHDSFWPTRAQIAAGEGTQARAGGAEAPSHLSR